MNKPYSAMTRSDCFMGTSHDFATFPELLQFCKENKVFAVANQEMADLDFDGLTDDERDQLDAV